MGSLPLRQSEAARMTKVALGAAALAGAAAVILFLLPKPRVEIDPRSLEPEIAADAPQTRRVHPTEAIGRQDWSRLANAVLLAEEAQPELAQWRANRQRMLDEEARRLAELQGVESGDEPASRSGGFAPSWRYIAKMDSGGVPMAIIAVGAVQRLVGEGYTQDDYTIERITPEKIIISQGRRVHEIKRGETARGTTLTGVSPNAGDPGVFDEDPFGAGRRAPTPRPRTAPR